jgi:hypothetical protein
LRLVTDANLSTCAAMQVDQRSPRVAYSSCLMDELRTL